MDSVPLKPQNLASPTRAPFHKLFHFSSSSDYFLIVLGSLGAVGMGILQPLFFYLMSDFFNGMSADLNTFYDKSLTVVYYLIIFGSVFTVVGWVAVMNWVIVGARQGSKFREHYFKAILDSDAEWLDCRTIAELPNSIATDTLKIERAAGDKLVVLIFMFSMIIASMILGIIEGLQLTLILLGFCPFVLAGLSLLYNGADQSARAADTSYRKAGGIVEEALQEIKTVASLNGQKHETKKYIASLSESHSSMTKNGLKLGLGSGLGTCMFLLMIASSYMIGARFINDGIYNWVDNKPYDIGKIIVVMFIGLLAFNNIGMLIPGIKIIKEGQFSAGRLLETLQTKSKLTNGSLKSEFAGEIKFEDVNFSYPTAKDTPVLRELSFSLSPGQRLGIVGATGSGKSTVLQLLLRYYEQDSGKVLIDGIDIRDYDIKFVRERISVVSQEPVLFNETIYENIRYGKLAANREEIENAAEIAGVMEFINDLPDGFNTSCGTKGAMLSGGQKQRVAIARAIVRRPKILLLDEATSALDRNTEQKVIGALENAFPDCTRIAIAQNLLTVEHSSKIIMIEKGVVIEKGTHKKLMKKKGAYFKLYSMQKLQMGTVDDAQERFRDRDSNIAEAVQIDDKQEQNKLKSLAYKKMMLLGKSEKGWLLLGCFSSILLGFFYPLAGLCSGLEIASLGSLDPVARFDDSMRYGYLMIIFGFVCFIAMTLEALSYPRMGANITKKIRELSFKTMICFDAAFYDQPENNCSALAARLSNDCEKVNSLGGSIFGIFLGIFSSLAVAQVAAALYSWRMSLVVLAILPLIVFAIGANFIAQATGIVKLNYESTTAMAADAIINYRTTKAFNLESEMLKRYLGPVGNEFKATCKKACSSGFAYGLGFGLIFYAYALLFWYGAKIVRDGDNSFEDMVTAMITAIVASDSVFQAGLYAPDMKNGIESGKRLFKMLEHEPTINVRSKEGAKKDIQGKIEFEAVNFSYPNRSYVAAKQVSFILHPGQSLGIIGRTGSGKSTIMQLLLRQYDVSSGIVKVDDINIKEFNIKHLRSQISIVSQEPVLFSGSIRENIAYGVKATEDEVVEAARKAQALEFIKEHQDGLEREVGIKGSKLSGGQKQRIAIARAIIRRPRILLMDEATSALDANTETEVLKNIRELISEATCVMIAHRLKTIDNCDFVMVMESGRISEYGEREELKAKGGYYSMMVSSL